MNKGIEAITSPVSTELKNGKQFYTYTKEDVETIEKALKALNVIEENLEYGYVFVGYDKDHKPLFQFANTKLYKEIKKNTTY